MPVLSIRTTVAAATAVAAAVAIAGCTSGTSGTSGTSTSASRHANSATRPCSTTYRAPDPHRPRMTVAFTVAPGHRTVTGRETVVFRPDLPIRELIFRLTANSAPSVSAGTSITVLSATADHGARPFTVTRAGAAASTQGGLLHIPFAVRLAAGTTVTARVAFRLTLGTVTSFDRFGRSGAFVYFGSGEPLLAWQRGVGWHTEELTGLSAETTTSEAMDVALSVRAPTADTVVMSGDPPTPARTTAATRTWRSVVPTARDVSVAAGPFAVADGAVGRVRVRVGDRSPAAARTLLATYDRAVQRLVTLFGPYPFASLSVARLVAKGGGYEYPSSILAFDSSASLAEHETAHQWFYAMVGNSQAQHPWLDESFATYAERLLDGDTKVDDQELALPTPLDQSVADYGSDDGSYIETTYSKGSNALLAARKAVGATAWDAAVRCYAAANAWRIAVPTDLRTALVGLPAATRVLQSAGAFGA